MELRPAQPEQVCPNTSAAVLCSLFHCIKLGLFQSYISSRILFVITNNQVHEALLAFLSFININSVKMYVLTDEKMIFKGNWPPPSWSFQKNNPRYTENYRQNLRILVDKLSSTTSSQTRWWLSDRNSHLRSLSIPNGIGLLRYYWLTVKEKKQRRLTRASASSPDPRHEAC